MLNPFPNSTLADMPASEYWTLIAERAEAEIVKMQALPTVSEQLGFVATFERDAQEVADRYAKRGLLRVATALRDDLRRRYLASECATLTPLESVMAAANEALRPSSSE